MLFSFLCVDNKRQQGREAEDGLSDVWYKQFKGELSILPFFELRENPLRK